MQNILYFAINKDADYLIREYSKINWAPFVLGFVIVRLEVGFIYAYKAGWQVSSASVVQSAFLAAALIFVGALLYNEAITRFYPPLIMENQMTDALTDALDNMVTGLSG